MGLSLSPRRLLYPAVAGVLFGVIAGVLCRACAGISLGMFFGPVALATLIVPPLVSGEVHASRRWLVPVAVSVGVVLVWLTAPGKSLTLSQWFACSVALLAYAGALCGITSLLIAARVNVFLAAGLVTIVALLWLTWPVWLSAQLLKPSGDALVGWLAPAHPLFAINGVLSHFDTWDRNRIAYGTLTVLNQDVFYALPRGAIWTTILHAVIAAVSCASEMLLTKWRRRREAVPAVDAP